MKMDTWLLVYMMEPGGKALTFFEPVPLCLNPKSVASVSTLATTDQGAVERSHKMIGQPVMFTAECRHTDICVSRFPPLRVQKSQIAPLWEQPSLTSQPDGRQPQIWGVKGVSLAFVSSLF